MCFWRVDSTQGDRSGAKGPYDIHTSALGDWLVTLAIISKILNKIVAHPILRIQKL